MFNDILIYMTLMLLLGIIHPSYLIINLDYPVIDYGLGVGEHINRHPCSKVNYSCFC